MIADAEVRSAVLAGLPWLEHGFGTRSSPPIGWPMATVKQVHSAEILSSGGTAGLKGEADAILNDTPGLAVGVKTADCVPILLADAAHHVVAAVHAGWRGTASEIVRLTVERMIEVYGTKPSEVFAAIGPSISECCFEVGLEVAREFSKWDSRLADTEMKTHIDLPDLNRRQLEEAGVPGRNIDDSRLCTMCGTERFYSFRKEKALGRQVSWIAIKVDPNKR